MFIAGLAEPSFDEHDLSSLRTGIMAGSPCPVEVMKHVIERMGITEVTICYGMTKTSPVSTPDNAESGRWCAMARPRCWPLFGRRQDIPFHGYRLTGRSNAEEIQNGLADHATADEVVKVLTPDAADRPGRREHAPAAGAPPAPAPTSLDRALLG